MNTVNPMVKREMIYELRTQLSAYWNRLGPILRIPYTIVPLTWTLHLPYTYCVALCLNAPHGMVLSSTFLHKLYVTTQDVIGFITHDIVV